MEFRFRPASPGDAAGLVRLNGAFNGPSDRTPSQVAESLASPGSERVSVAQAGEGNGGRLAGFCCCQVKRSFCYARPSVEVTEFYVEGDCRRQGVGRGLMGCVFRLCQELGAEELSLLTGDDNLGAQAFYTGMGFSPTGELHLGAEPLQL